MVTASAPDLAPAWTGQLGDGGRLLVPLTLRGIKHSVAFRQAGITMPHTRFLLDW